MFYDRFKRLCEKKGVSCNKAALEIGLSNATPTKWKKTGATPVGETLDKIAAYFDVSTDYLLGKETEKAPADQGKRSVSPEDIKFALFKGREDITDEMYQEILAFADYVMHREDEKRKKD